MKQIPEWDAIEALRSFSVIRRELGLHAGCSSEEVLVAVKALKVAANVCQGALLELARTRVLAGEREEATERKLEELRGTVHALALNVDEVRSA